MTDTTPRASVPLLSAAQAQKHVTHNDALLELDALLYCRILDRDLTDPPATPVDGDTYLVKATGTGIWAGQDGNIAYAVDGGWRFYAPFEGLTAFIADEAVMLVHTASGWSDWASLFNLQNVPLLGVNTTADATNKLATKSSALLFDNIGAGIQAKFNKTVSTDTASILYQTSYSGRAEFGLTGDDDFHIKVSPDGATWHEGLTIDAATGAVNAQSPSLTGSTQMNFGAVTDTLTFHRTDVAVADAAFNVSGGGGGLLNLSVGGATIMAFASDHVVFGGTDLAIGHSEKGVLTLPNGEYIGAYNAAGTDDYYLIGADAAGIIQIGGNAGTLAVDPALGAVGIGTAAPNSSAALDIAGHIYPHADNIYDLGSASYRMGTIYSGTGTINTSGAGTKASVRDLTDAELRVAIRLAGHIRIYQFCDAVTAKGAEAARLHTGMIYEEVVGAFSAEGLDPARYGIVCSDPAFRIVSRTRTVKRPKMQTVTLPDERVVVKDGVATLRTGDISRERQVTLNLGVVDADGNPVIDAQTGRQRIHRAPVFETVTESYDESVPDLDAGGVQKQVLGIRYAELAQFVMSGLAARLAALEATS